MPAVRRLRKPAIWAGIVCLLLALLYCGAYFRSVNRVYAAEAFEDETGTTFRATALPRYALPWPVPAHLNNGWVHGRLDAAFAPMYRLDRRLRPDLWKETTRYVPRTAPVDAP